MAMSSQNAQSTSTSKKAAPPPNCIRSYASCMGVTRATQVTIGIITMSHVTRLRE